jgi:hypothetical protein
VADKLIPEPQRTYVLELLTNLGPAADSFVLAGAQALKFLLPKARATRDFDFVLDVVVLREASIPIATILEKLGYVAIPGAQNFQFQKAIPDSTEIMRIEFMAPSEYKRKNDFRVDVQANLHAHACDGGKIVLAESELRDLSGRLPNGQDVTIKARIALPHSLVLLKCLAMDDRYRNVRGPEHAEHDRSEARTHVEDIVAVLTAQTNLADFRANCSRQFSAEPPLKPRVSQIVTDYFADESKPGILLYEESLRERIAGQGSADSDLRRELQHAQRLVVSCLALETQK